MMSINNEMRQNFVRNWVSWITFEHITSQQQSVSSLKQSCVVMFECSRKKVLQDKVKSHLSFSTTGLCLPPPPEQDINLLSVLFPQHVTSKLHGNVITLCV